MENKNDEVLRFSFVGMALSGDKRIPLFMEFKNGKQDDLTEEPPRSSRRKKTATLS